MVNPAICATTAMLARLFYPYFELSFGTIYPAYASWKSMKTRDRHQYQRWMMYWVTYGAFQLIQIFTDMFLGFWFPFYFELKVILLIWLVSLNGHGAKLLFTHVINHELTKHEKAIDVYFDRVSGLGNEIIWRGWTECSRLAPKVISILLRLMIATSEGLPYIDLGSSNKNDSGQVTTTELDSNQQVNYDEPPDVDDINVIASMESVDSDAISTYSDDLIKSVRAANRARSSRNQTRTLSMDSLDRITPMDCDIDRTLVAQRDEAVEEERPRASSTKKSARKQSKPRASKGRKGKLETDEPAEEEARAKELTDGSVSDAGASDISVPTSPSKSRSRILRKPRVIRKPNHYAPA